MKENIIDYEKLLTGNHSVSYGAMLSKVQMISAYPITPQTTIVELLSELVANGKIKAVFTKVESEHSAMSACIGASAAGVRAFTATSAQGLALMHEMLHWASASRLPVVLADVNRAMAPPWSIWTDQTDSLAQRDTGWMQFYLESNQEVLDFVIITFKVAEQVFLPGMLVLDAFVLSHTYEPVQIYKQEYVDEYLPQFKPMYVIEPGNKIAYGPLGGPDVYMEFRYKIQKAMEKALTVIKSAFQEFNEKFGRNYGIFEEFMCDDADYILVTSGAVSSTVKYAVDKIRKETGAKLGVLRMIVFRPFPFEDIRNVLKGRKKLGIIDRSISFGASGIFYQEIKSALFPLKDNEKPLAIGYIMGLGGRDITVKDIEDIYNDLVKRERMEEIIWKGVKE